MMGVAIDVTERKRAVEEIGRREAQLAEAQRIAHLGSYEWNVRSGAVQRSEELCRIFGVEPRDFPPTFQNYLDRVHPEDRDATRTAVERSFRDREPFEFEERILRPDGQTRVLHSQGKWTLDRGGEPVSLVGISQDVTERRDAEQLLRSSEERFQLVARATNDVDLGLGPGDRRDLVEPGHHHRVRVPAGDGRRRRRLVARAHPPRRRRTASSPAPAT